MDHTILDQEQNEIRPQDIEYATFWRRVGAQTIDQIILSLFSSLLVYLASGYVAAYGYVITLFSSLVIIVYKIFMEKEYGQTIGKILTNIKVTDDDFNPLTYGQVIKRNYYVILSTTVSLLLIFNVFKLPAFGHANASYTGAMMSQMFHPIYLLLVIIYCIDCAAMTSNDTKKTLHDMLGKTIVVKMNV